MNESEQRRQYSLAAYRAAEASNLRTMTQSELNHGTEQVMTPTREPLDKGVSGTIMSDGMQLTPSVANTNTSFPVEQTLASAHSPLKRGCKLTLGLSSGIDQKENQYSQLPSKFHQTFDKQSLQCSLHPSQAGLWTEDKLQNLEMIRMNELKSFAEQIHDTIMKDEMANTYKLSNVTQEFFKDRVIEVIFESLASEKESKIQSLLVQLGTQQRDFNQSMTHAQEVEKLRKRCTQIPVLQSKIQDLDQRLMATHQNHEAELLDRQADIEYRQEQYRLLKEKLEKAEKQSSVKTLALQEMESQVNQLKRICESLTEDKDMLERRIQDQQEDLEQDGIHQQTLKQQFLETQFKLKQAAQENEQLKKRVKGLEIEKKDIVGKFDEFGERLGEQMNTQHQQTISQLTQTHQDQTQMMEKQIQELKIREGQLQEEIETARELQVAIAQRMKEDIRAIRDEWAAMLAEKDVEMKKQEASEALRIKSSNSELSKIHQVQVKEIQAANAQDLLRIKTEYEIKLRDFEMQAAEHDQKMNEMIKITEHEHILNIELNKASNLAQSQLEQLQKTLEQQFMSTIQERVKECESAYETQLSDLKETLTKANKQLLDRQTQENNWKLRQLGQETQYKIQDQAQQHQLQLEEALANVSRLEEQNKRLTNTEQSQANCIVELKQELSDQLIERRTTIHKLENKLNDTQREVQLVERQRKTLQSKIQNQKEHTKLIVSSIQDKVACTVASLRQELLETRSELHHTQDESAQIVKEVRTLVSQVNQKLSGQMEELTIDKEQLEDALDTLRDRLRTSEGRTQRVANEKRQNIEIVKSDFKQVIEVAKQEVQRKYCFELKQLKRCILHLKSRLSEELDNKQREIDQIQSLFKQERSQLETEIRIAYQRVNEMRAYGIRSNVSHQTKAVSTIVSTQSTHQH